MQFALYVVGYIVLVAGILYGINLMGIPPQWVAVFGIILAGSGIIAMSKRLPGNNGTQRSV